MSRDTYYCITILTVGMVWTLYQQRQRQRELDAKIAALDAEIEARTTHLA